MFLPATIAFLLVSQAPVEGDAAFRDFDVYATTALKDWKTPGMAVSVVKDGRVVFSRGFGVRKIGGIDVDADTIFPIASITKAFNATAIAILVEEGKLAWTDRVTKHLPDFQLGDPFVTREVSLADLMSHRTGLGDPELLSYSAPARPELLRRLKFVRQADPFRVGYRYNNLGTIVSGEILERVAGQSWTDFIRKRILVPLEMRSTVPDVLELKGVANVATSYVEVNGELQEDRSWNLPLAEGWRRYRETIRPAGAICSSANDMAKFLTFHLGNGEYHGRRILKADTLLEMQALHSVSPLKPPASPYLTYAKFLFGAGLGWEIRDYRGRKLVMHRGSTGTVIGFMPEERIGVVVLTNLGSGIQYMVMHDVLDRLLGIARTWTNREFIAAAIDDYEKARNIEKNRIERERRQDLNARFALKRYTGRYHSDLLGELIVSESGGGLEIALGPNCRAELTHWSGECFRATFVLRFQEDWLVSFGVGDGKVKSVRIVNVFPSGEIGTFERAE